MSIKLWLAAIALSAFTATAAFGAYQKSRADRAQARADAAEALVEGYKEANRILDSHLRKAEQERDRWEQVAQELESEEGIDEPLNSYERSVLERVRRP